jgi:hypothetical protein
MWLYPGHPPSNELSTTEVDSRIHRGLNLGVNPSPGAGPSPLQKWVANARVSTLGPVLVAYAILSFHGARGLAQGLEGSNNEP